MIQLKVARKRVNDGAQAIVRFLAALVAGALFWLRVGWRLFKMGVNSFMRVMVPVVVRLIVLALVLGFPLSVGMFIEWSYLPSDWHIWTRIAVGLSWVGIVALIALGVMDSKTPSESAAVKQARQSLQ